MNYDVATNEEQHRQARLQEDLDKFLEQCLGSPSEGPKWVKMR